MPSDQLDAIAYTIKGAAAASGITRSKIFDLIREGKLDSRKCGRRNLIPADSLRAYIASLPPARPKLDQPRAA